MRQAGRYQKAYRDLALKHPSFRERSENTDLIVEISLQPWESFRPDGVILFRCGAGGWCRRQWRAAAAPACCRCRAARVRARGSAGGRSCRQQRLPQRGAPAPAAAHPTAASPTQPAHPPPCPPACSDILTPLPAFGIPFEIDDNKGPLLDATIRSAEGLKALHAIDLQQLSFVGESLGLIKQAVGGQAATLGFVGCPWTLATYVVEGASSSIYKNIKSMMFNGGRARGCWGPRPGGCTLASAGLLA